MELRHHPVVVAALEEWWSTARNSLRSGAPLAIGRAAVNADWREGGNADDGSAGGEGGSLGDAEVACALRKEHYIDIWCRIHRVLIGGSPYRAAAAAEAEWDIDRKGAVVLTRELWLDAIFDLADTWTRGVEVSTRKSGALDREAHRRTAAACTS